jgi:hypothetical protein
VFFGINLLRKKRITPSDFKRSEINILIFINILESNGFSLVDGTKKWSYFLKINENYYLLNVQDIYLFFLSTALRTS